MADIQPEQLKLFSLPPAAPAPRQRQIHLGNRIVAYDLATGRRRLAMAIDERGLRVGAPRGASNAEIEDFLRQHADWVIRKLDEFAGRRNRRLLAIRDGVHLPVFGEPVPVRVRPGGNRATWENGADGEDAALILFARPDADLDALARRALQRRAAGHFQERARLFAERLGHTLPPVALSSARSRWGSCSRRTGLRFNWRLIHLPAELVDYVVAHEVAHLAEMNHSPRFWSQVERLFPDWRRARADLRRLGADIPLI